MPKYPHRVRERIIKRVFRELRTGKSIKAACEITGINIDSWYAWITRGLVDAEEYARVRQEQIQYHLDTSIQEIEDLQDKLTNRKDSDNPVDGKTLNALVQAYRLKVDTVKWFASKIIPLYRDTQTIEHEHRLSGRPSDAITEFIDAEIVQDGQDTPQIPAKTGKPLQSDCNTKDK